MFLQVHDELIVGAVNNEKEAVERVLRERDAKHAKRKFR